MLKQDFKMTKKGKPRQRNYPSDMTKTEPEKLDIVTRGIVPLNIITRAVPYIDDGIVYRYYDRKFLAFYQYGDAGIIRIGLYRTRLEAVQVRNWYLLETNIYGKYTRLLLNPEVDFEKLILDTCYPDKLPPYITLYSIDMPNRYNTHLRVEGISSGKFSWTSFSLGTYDCLEVAVRVQNSVKEYLNKNTEYKYELFQLKNGEVL